MKSAGCSRGLRRKKTEGTFGTNRDVEGVGVAILPVLRRANPLSRESKAKQQLCPAKVGSRIEMGLK